jgi:predicted exporter
VTRTDAASVGRLVPRPTGRHTPSAEKAVLHLATVRLADPWLFDKQTFSRKMLIPGKRAGAAFEKATV